MAWERLDFAIERNCLENVYSIVKDKLVRFMRNMNAEIFHSHANLSVYFVSVPAL